VNLGRDFGFGSGLDGVIGFGLNYGLSFGFDSLSSESSVNRCSYSGLLKYCCSDCFEEAMEYFSR
jgi:hypothetical protein